MKSENKLNTKQWCVSNSDKYDCSDVTMRVRQNAEASEVMLCLQAGVVVIVECVREIAETSG